MNKNVEIELFDKDKTVYTIRRDTLNSNKMVCGPFFSSNKFDKLIHFRHLFIILALFVLNFSFLL